MIEYSFVSISTHKYRKVVCLQEVCIWTTRLVFTLLTCQVIYNTFCISAE